MSERSTALEPDLLRDVLGHSASGVTVVAGLVDGSPVGFTCQSFHSLSLDPPMVLVVPGRGSTSWPKIRTSGYFCVNVLASDQAAISAIFAVSGGDKFAKTGWAPAGSGSPILAGVSAWIDCAIAAEYEGGDHLIVCGSVLDLSSDPDSHPLVFHRGVLRNLEPT